MTPTVMARAVTEDPHQFFPSGVSQCLTRGCGELGWCPGALQAGAPPRCESQRSAPGPRQAWLAIIAPCPEPHRRLAHAR